MRPRLVVLYAVCTVNKDYLQPYNGEVAYTPHLAHFGAESAVLSNHRTESGVSGTAYASIFTGTQADRHGVFRHPQELDSELYLIFEAFRDAGYETYYWSAHGMARPGLAYSQGVKPRDVVKRPLTGDDVRFKRLLKGLAEKPDRQALVVTAFSVTHAPWDLRQMPEFRRSFPGEVKGLRKDEIAENLAFFRQNQFALQTDIDGVAAELNLSPQRIERLGAALDVLYKSKINLLDSYFGSMLEAVDAAGLSDESLVAFTADHGQQMADGELFRWTHGPDLAPDVVDVPWIIRGPAGSISSGTIEEVTRSIDVYPTLAGLAGFALPPESGVAGTDLSAALRGAEAFPEQTAYSHGTLRNWSYFQPDLIENIWASTRVGDRLYTWRRQDDAWNLSAQRVVGGLAAERLDPSAPEHEAAGRDLWNYRAGMIDAFRATHPDEAQSKDESLGRLKEADAEALRALGYIE